MANFALVFGSYTMTNVQSAIDNFDEAVSRVEKLAGVSGGFDSFGQDPSPTNIGRVIVDYVLVAQSRDDMQALRDTARGLQYVGRALLTKTLQGSLGTRSCYAKAVKIDISEQQAQHTDLKQPVRITFEVSDPHWYGAEDTDTANILSTTQDITVAHAGNSIAIPRIVIACGAARTAVNPKVQRIVGGIVVDEVAFTGTVAASTSLIIDSQAKSVKNNGVDAYATFTFTHPDWLRLLPGDNTIRIIADNTAASLRTISLYHYPTYT